jgi:hypothetical protein
MVNGSGGSVTPGMRRMLWVAAGLVLVQGTILLVFHNNTSRYFSWTIAVPVTAAFLGAGYLAAAVLESAAARQSSWQRARIAVPGVLAFTTLTLVVTLVHLGKFHLGSAVLITRTLTWGWLAIYVGVPPVLAFLWWRQARAVPSPAGSRRRAARRAGPGDEAVAMAADRSNGAGPDRGLIAAHHGRGGARLGPSAGILVNCLTRLVCLPADPQARRKSPSR